MILLLLFQKRQLFRWRTPRPSTTLNAELEPKQSLNTTYPFGSWPQIRAPSWSMRASFGIIHPAALSSHFSTAHTHPWQRPYPVSLWGSHEDGPEAPGVVQSAYVRKCQFTLNGVEAASGHMPSKGLVRGRQAKCHFICMTEEKANYLPPKSSLPSKSSKNLKTHKHSQSTRTCGIARRTAKTFNMFSRALYSFSNHIPLQNAVPPTRSAANTPLQQSRRTRCVFSIPNMHTTPSFVQTGCVNKCVRHGKTPLLVQQC